MTTSLTVPVAGAELAAEVTGEGTPVVWGHGLTSSRAHEDDLGLFDWSGLAAVARLVRYDARGHGESTGTPDSAGYRWDALAGDMLAVADAVGADRFVAGGASMGCATALHATVTAPDRVEGLVLVIPPTAWATRRAQASLYEGGAMVVETEGLATLLDLLDARPQPALFAEELPEVAAVTRRHAERLDPALLPSVLRGAAASDLPEPDELAAIRAPALILAWDGDAGHPVSTATRLAEVLPRAALHVASTVAELRRWPELVRAHVDSVLTGPSA